MAEQSRTHTHRQRPGKIRASLHDVDPEAAIAVIDAEIARLSLYDFVKLAWPRVFPQSSFSDNWHVGAICLPYQSVIHTESGPMQIGDIVEGGWEGRVVSKNHGTGKLEMRRVLCRMKSPGQRLVSIRTASGETLKLTGNHPVYVSGRGYVRADEVSVGDGVIKLQAVQRCIPPQPFAGYRQFLQPHLLWYSQEEAANGVCGLWQGGPGSSHDAMSGLPHKNAHERRHDSVQWVRCGSVRRQVVVEGKQPAARLLLRDAVLREVLPWGEQLGVHRRRQPRRVPGWLPQDQEGCANSRRLAVLSVPETLREDWPEASHVESGCSPYRRRQGEQLHVESGGPVQVLPQPPEGDSVAGFREVGDTVVSVVAGLPGPDCVYNIEVEGNNNYFADGVLVHNCEHLEALTSLELTSLVINMPPRHGKSAIVSVFWPAWVWLNQPAFQWAFFSYDGRLAERDAVRTRDLVRSQWYVQNFGVEWMISEDVNAKDIYRTTAQGARISTTPGSLGAGLDADGLVVDDAHNIRDGSYAGRLENTCEWFDQTTTTRGNNPRTFVRLVVGQRIAEGDLPGHLIRAGWPALILPARHEPARHYPSLAAAAAANEPHPIVPTPVQERSATAKEQRTEEGEPLWKTRFGENELRVLENGLRAFGTAGQLQQRPSPRTGGIFQSAHFRVAMPGLNAGRVGVLLRPSAYEESLGIKPVFYDYADLRFFQCIDTAMTLGDDASYTVVGTFAVTRRADLIVWDIWRYRLEVPYQYAAIMALRDGPGVWSEERKLVIPIEGPGGKAMTWPRPLYFQAIEPKASGIALIQLAAAKGRSFKALAVKGDKVERAAVISTMYFSGKVYHRYGGDFVSAFEQELVSFPAGARNDQVDVVSYAGVLTQQDAILQQYFSGDILTHPDAGTEVDWSAPDAWDGDPPPVVTTLTGPVHTKPEDTKSPWF